MLQTLQQEFATLHGFWQTRFARNEISASKVFYKAAAIMKASTDNKRSRANHGNVMTKWIWNPQVAYRWLLKLTTCHIDEQLKGHPSPRSGSVG